MALRNNYKFTDEARQSVLDSIRKGMSHADAARSARVTYDCLMKWLQKARESKNGKYREFLDNFEQAELEIKEFWIEEFKKGDTDTTATIESVAGKPTLERKTIRRKSPNASKWLAMRYPEEFGQQAIGKLTDDKVVDRFFQVIEKRHGQQYADFHREVYEEGQAEVEQHAEYDESELRNGEAAD